MSKYSVAQVHAKNRGGFASVGKFICSRKKATNSTYKDSKNYGKGK